MANIRKVPFLTPFQDDSGRLDRTWIKFWEEIPEGLIDEETILGYIEKKATFGLNRSLRTGEVSLTNHFISRSAGTFQEVVVNAKVAPTGQTARIDIKKSSDEGSSWASIFAAGYIELAVGATDLQFYTSVFLDPPSNQIAINDMLRVDCVRAGSVVAGRGIEIVTRWE